MEIIEFFLFALGLIISDTYTVQLEFTWNFFVQIAHDHHKFSTFTQILSECPTKIMIKIPALPYKLLCEGLTFITVPEFNITLTTNKMCVWNDILLQLLKS